MKCDIPFYVEYSDYLYYLHCWENRVLQLVSEQVDPSGQVVESCSVVRQFMTVIVLSWLLFVVKRTKMAGRNDIVIAAALQAMAYVVGQQPNVGAGANDGVRML